MTTLRTLGLTTLAMIAFAGNSILCRLALRETAVDPASFTSIRLLSGALMLWLLVSLRNKGRVNEGNWMSSLMLFAYAAGFSFAYVSLTAATGALLLFGAVQVTMISFGIRAGERLKGVQWFGFLLAFGGLTGLLLPGLSAPPLGGSVLMLGAGVAWGVYSLRGQGAGDATAVTAGNFRRAVPIALLLSLLMFDKTSLDPAGIAYAVASGALASGLGYAIWYTVLPGLKSTSAASVQLSVPVIAAMGGIVFLSEDMSMRLLVTSVAILGGVALVIAQNRK
jgi:drug/metabolite transporter (DMT)-like permease